MKKAIKFILAILLFICLAKMPYGYYQLVRVLAFVGFIYLAYEANKAKKSELTFAFIAGAIIFNPVFKLAFGREIWMIVDVIAGMLLIVSGIYELKNKKA